MNREARELWLTMLAVLETEMSAISYDVWIKTLDVVDIVDGKLVLKAQNEDCKNFVVTRFLPLIRDVMKKENPLLTEVVLIDPSEEDKYVTATEKVDEPEETVRIEPNIIDPKYNFENFVVGKSNQLVYAAAVNVAEEPGQGFNPLFIYGGVGLGKTHIMHAIGNAVRINHPQLKTLYVTSEKFVNEFIRSIRTNKGNNTSAFREKYRNVDVLMIDDIQFIANKPGTQEEMFHTFNDLYQSKKQLVFSSDRPPKEIPDLEDRLRSRFEWGLITDIQPPDLETRIAILQKKAQMEKQNLPMDVLTFMAEKIDTNIREMEGLLKKVIFLSKLSEKPPTIDLVKEALKDYGDVSDGEITSDEILAKACEYFRISRDDLIGKKKIKEIVEARHICMYLMTEMLTLPLKAIGNIFGGRDHTTVIHARDMVAEKMQSNVKTKLAVQDIKNLIYRK
ncbi:MAG: chromosomal replication initiator protein DnaA [Clostridia bacterium]|nr:chromosomal replication initiator protein DnaA [Clostridia bacterium]